MEQQQLTQPHLQEPDGKGDEADDDEVVFEDSHEGSDTAPCVDGQLGEFLLQAKHTRVSLQVKVVWVRRVGRSVGR